MKKKLKLIILIGGIVFEILIGFLFYLLYLKTEPKPEQIRPEIPPRPIPKFEDPELIDKINEYEVFGEIPVIVKEEDVGRSDIFRAL